MPKPSANYPVLRGIIFSIWRLNNGHPSGRMSGRRNEHAPYLSFLFNGFQCLKWVYLTLRFKFNDIFWILKCLCKTRRIVIFLLIGSSCKKLNFLDTFLCAIFIFSFKQHQILMRFYVNLINLSAINLFYILQSKVKIGLCF